MGQPYSIGLIEADADQAMPDPPASPKPAAALPTSYIAAAPPVKCKPPGMPATPTSSKLPSYIDSMNAVQQQIEMQKRQTEMIIAAQEKIGQLKTSMDNRASKYRKDHNDHKSRKELRTQQSSTECPLSSSASFVFSELIKASDVPQWGWSNRQCKEWLKVFLVEKCGLSSYDAQRIADDSLASGCGPTLYFRRIRDWAHWMTRDVSISVYSTIMSGRHEPGAVPSNIIIPCFESDCLAL